MEITMNIFKIRMISILMVCLVFCGLGCAAEKSYVVPGDVAVFDLWKFFDDAGIDTIEERADAIYFITSLQGIVNREQPRLYIFAALALFDVETKHYFFDDYKTKPVTELDKFWFNHFRKEGYFKDRKIIPINSLESLINRYRSEIDGLVMWDMDVPATSNLALTAAGCEGLLPVSKNLADGKFYTKIAKAAPWLDVKLDLCGMFDGKKDIIVDGKIFPSTGSAKNDVYKYIIERYLRPGLANPYKMWFNCDASMWGKFRSHYGEKDYGYLGDKNELQQNGMYNADYWVAQKGVFYDLSPWADCKPFDDPEQPLGADNKSWHDILETSYHLRKGEFGIVGGFVPWWIKYTSHIGEKHGDVETEWEFVALLTAYNMANDGDAAFGIANSSFFQHLPAVSREQAKFIEPEPIEYESDATYIAFLMMDYDGSAWTNQMITSVYNDPARGKVPLNWVINPALNFRIPHAIKYIYDNRTPNDFLGFSGDGAAYIQPDSLFNRNGRIQESGQEHYMRFARELNERYGIEYNVFYIDDTFGKEWSQMAAEITPKGFGVNLRVDMMVGDTPVTHVPMFHIAQAREMQSRVVELYKNSTQAEQYAASMNIYRCILIPPTMIYDAVKEGQAKYPNAKVRIIDVPNYFRLLKTKLTTPLVTPYSVAESVEASGDNMKGLRPVLSPDAAFELVERKGVKCWQIDGSQKSKYMSFAVDDGFRANMGRDIVIEIEYWDGQDVSFLLEYDSAQTSLPLDGAYKYDGHNVVTTNTGQWKAATFRIKDAFFQARQNDRTDFRLANTSTNPVVIKAVKVIKVP